MAMRVDCVKKTIFSLNAAIVDTICRNPVKEGVCEDIMNCKFDEITSDKSENNLNSSDNIKKNPK